MTLDIVDYGHQVMKSAVAVPQSIPGLVTKDILVMTFLEGEQITRLKVCADHAWLSYGLRGLMCQYKSKCIHDVLGDNLGPTDKKFGSVKSAMCSVLPGLCYVLHADMS